MTRTLYAGALDRRHRCRSRVADLSSRMAGSWRWGRGLDADVASTQEKRACPAFRLPHPRRRQQHRHDAPAPDTVQLSLLPGGAQPRGDLRIGITTVRDAGRADLGVKQAVDNGLVTDPDADQPQHDQPDRRSRRWLDAVRRYPPGACWPRIPACRTLVDGPEKCVERCASWSAWAPTSSRSPPLAACFRRVTSQRTHTPARSSGAGRGGRTPPGFP